MGLPHTQACVKGETESVHCAGGKQRRVGLPHTQACVKRETESVHCAGGKQRRVQEKGQREGRGARKPNCGSVRVVTVTIHSQEPQ